MLSRNLQGTLGLLRGFLLSIALFSAFCEGIQVCEQKIANCEGDACFKSIACYHGDCNEEGICECDLCWEGESCQDYVDNYFPEFITTEETALVSDRWSPETVYTALAFDADLGTTCPADAMLCDCADISYSITSGDINKLFYINNLTGDIYVKEASQVVSGKTYNLTITASTAKGKVSPSPNAHMELKVVIDDLHHHLQQVLRQNVLSWLGEDIMEGDVLSRKKRSVDNNNYMTQFNFSLINGELETMEAGRRLDYRLEIMVPKTDGMDLTVELFTKEVGNGNYTPVLALFNVMMDDKPDGLTFSKGDEPHIEMLLSDEIMTTYDRAIITFGSVKNTNENPVPIYMLFSVTQIKNPVTVYDSKYLVTAGAEYDKETYIWVGQYEVTVHNSTDEKSLEVDILGPTEIPLDSAGVYVMVTHCAVRSDNFTFEITGPEEKEVVTVGNLGVKDFDKNYDPVPQSIYFYNTTKEGSDDNVIYTKAIMNLGIMTNVGNYQYPRDEGNVINVTFAIYALNNETHLGKEVEFTTTVIVGRDVLHFQQFKVKLVPRKPADKMVTIRTTFGDLTTKNVGIGDMAMYTLWSNLTNNAYADYVLEVGILDFKGIPRLEACSARLWNYKGSFDVPYLNTTFIDPEIKDGKFLFKFSRIHVTGQRTPSIYNDSMIYIHLIMKVSALSVNKEGTSLGPKLKIGTLGVPEQTVAVPSLTIQKKTDYLAPAMVVENGVQWDYLYLGGAIVLNITMLVPEGQGYAEVFMEASGENNPPLPSVHICRTELSDVGRNVPCLRMHQDEVNAQYTKYSKTDPKNRLKPDMTSIMLGDVGALPVEGRNFARVSVVVELPDNSIIKENEQYPISAGLLIATNTIWSAMANYTMKKSAPPDLEEFQMPGATVHHDENEKVLPGHLADVEVWVDTKIQTISTVIIEVEGVTRDISLCGLKVKSFGRNLPCVDKDTEPFYHPHANPLDGNKVAGLKFLGLSNVGFRSNEEHDRLKVIALVRIGPSCKKPQTELQWRVIYGGGKREGSINIKVDLNADTSDLSVASKEPKALAFKPAYPNRAITMGSPVVVDLEVSLEPGSLAPVIVELKNMDADKKLPYEMCLGGIWFRGRNYPCFSPVQVESNFTSSSSEMDGRKDTAVYNLGLVCNTFVDNKEEENKVTIRVAMRPVDDGSLKMRETFNVAGFATVGTHRKKIDTLKFSIAQKADEIETKVNATVKLVIEEPIPIKIHQRLWIPFNITIPIDALVKVTAEARAPIKNNRAILSVHNMRLKSGGINIPCPMLYPQPSVFLNSTSPTTQKDVARAYIGYFTNLGLSHKMNMAEKGDDDLTIEVLVEMSDHPLTDHDKEFKLKFIAQVGKAVVEVDQPIEVVRDGTERADLDVKILVDSAKAYQSGDHINITINVHHKLESTAEPINATIRLYLPPYVEFDSKVFNNATVVGDVQFIPDNGGLDIMIPQFLFSDSATIIVSLLADPKNERGFGRGEINATTPYRVLCLQNFREEPSPNPTAPDTIVNCGPVDYIMYVVNSQECYKVLGLNSPKKIYKCQLSASSAARKDLGPYNIRSGGKKGWSPALRLGPHKPYFQVDFLRTTRVSKLEFIKVDDTRSIIKYRLQYSHTGSDWLYANEVTELMYRKGKAFDELEKPIQTRFVRIVLEEAEKGEEDTKYIGLKMELYGCYIAEKQPSVTCAKTDPTWYSDDKNKYGRHFSVDTGRDIIYFCDLEYDMLNLVCFSSTDAGTSWRILPKSFGGVLGYDKKSGRTYAFDKRKRAHIASDDGVSWIAVDETEVNNTAAKKTFYRSQPVPAFTTEDIEMLETKTGRWEASFDGLMYEGKPDPRARWSRCCKMK